MLLSVPRRRVSLCNSDAVSGAEKGEVCLETWDATNFCPVPEGLPVIFALRVTVWDAKEFPCRPREAHWEWKQSWGDKMRCLSEEGLPEKNCLACLR